MESTHPSLFILYFFIYEVFVCYYNLSRLYNSQILNQHLIQNLLDYIILLYYNPKQTPVSSWNRIVSAYSSRANNELKLNNASYVTCDLLGSIILARNESAGRQGLPHQLLPIIHSRNHCHPLCLPDRVDFFVSPTAIRLGLCCCAVSPARSYVFFHILISLEKIRIPYTTGNT